MAEIILFVKGLALVYKNNNSWHLFLPFDHDHCHSGEFKYKKHGQKWQSIRLAETKKGKTINITKADPGSLGHIPSEFIDLSAVYAHGSHALGRKPVGAGDNAVEIVLNDGILGIDHRNLVEETYAVVKEVGNNEITVVEHVSSFPRNLFIKIDFAKMDLAVNLQDGDIISFDHGSDQRHMIIIDNDCDNPLIEANDFQRLYEGLTVNKTINLEWINHQVLKTKYKSGTGKKFSKLGLKADQDKYRRKPIFLSPEANDSTTKKNSKKLLMVDDITYPCFVIQGSNV